MVEGPRLVRPVSDPLGHYLRPGRSDHKKLLTAIASGHDDYSGLVFAPWQSARHEELRFETRKAGREAIFDPFAMDLATPGGIRRAALTQLDWVGEQLPHTPLSLNGSTGAQMVAGIAQQVIEEDFSAVLAPTHYLQTGTSDGWFTVDGRLVHELRTQLDAAGRSDIPIYYPLAIHSRVLANPAERERIVSALSVLPIDAVWLSVHPFGTTSSGPTALRNYIKGARDFHRLGLPIVGAHTGTVGLALLAFGAVSGIEGGITYGERFNMGGLLNPKDGKAFSPPTRVYLPKIGAFLKRQEARGLFENRQMKSALACRDKGCCRRGDADTDLEPLRHFVIQRGKDVTAVGQPPEFVRAGEYLETVVRPATDLAVRAAKVLPSLGRTRDRLEGWRTSLGELQRTAPAETFAPVPKGQRVQTSRRDRGAGRGA